MHRTTLPIFGVLAFVAAVAITACGREAEIDGDAGAGDDAGACKDQTELLGRWERNLDLQVGDVIHVDRWVVIFDEDCHFEWTYDETDNTEVVPFEVVETRQGTYAIETAEGRITLEGSLTWHPDSSAHQLQSQVMIALDQELNALFMGPDSRLFTSWPYTNSYYILRRPPFTDTYAREFSIRIEDDSGEPEEVWSEVFEFSIEESGCSGSYQTSYASDTQDEQAEGEFVDCEYALTEAVETEWFDEEVLQVQAVVLAYEGDDLPQNQEFYFALGDVLVGFNPSMQSVGLRHAAYVRTHTADEL